MRIRDKPDERISRIVEKLQHNTNMSRKGNCLDKSIMENFFGRLKVEMFYSEKFLFIDRLKKYIDLLQ